MEDLFDPEHFIHIVNARYALDDPLALGRPVRRWHGAKPCRPPGQSPLTASIRVTVARHSRREDMDDVELDLLKRLHEDVFDSVETEQRLTVADIREWHRRWLGNVHVWAGSYRTVNMGKGGFQFAASGQVPRLMDNLDKEVLAVRTPVQECPKIN